MPSFISDLTPVTKKIIITNFVIASIGLVVGLFFTANHLEYFLGILFGTFVSVVRIILIEMSMNRIIDMEAPAAKNMAALNYLTRLILTAAALIAAALIPFIDLVGTVIAIFIFQLSVYIASKLFAKKDDQSKK